MRHLELVHLPPLMQQTSGHPDIKIGLVDGPVFFSHPDLEHKSLYLLGEDAKQFHEASIAVQHGTAVAGVLKAKRGGAAPAICPDCSLLVRPIFAISSSADKMLPGTTLTELAHAIFDCVQAGARLLNLSVGLVQTATSGKQEFVEALDYAVRREVLIVAAAGNQGWIGDSLLTAFPGTLPVVACDLQGHPLTDSNLGISAGKRGLSAPGVDLPSLGLGDKPFLLTGTSAATPLVTGTLALLWSLFPAATAAQLRYAILGVADSKRTTIVPPLLHAWNAYHVLATIVHQNPKRRILV